MFDKKKENTILFAKSVSEISSLVAVVKLIDDKELVKRGMSNTLITAYKKNNKRIIKEFINID